MNVTALIKRPTRVAFSILACLAVLGSALAVPTGAALAADVAAPPAQDGARLSLLLERVQLAYESQSYRIDLAHQSAELTQEWIDLLASEGHDTTDLEAALSEFNRLVSEAEGYHDDAGAILASPAGFDSDGNVTDRQQAVNTLREAGQALRDSHRDLVDATITLHRAIQDYRQALRPVEASQ